MSFKPGWARAGAVIIRGLYLNIKNAEALKWDGKGKQWGEGRLQRLLELCCFGENQEAG